jgi:hypothetical protein
MDSKEKRFMKKERKNEWKRSDWRRIVDVNQNENRFTMKWNDKENRKQHEEERKRWKEDIKRDEKIRGERMGY